MKRPQPPSAFPSRFVALLRGINVGGHRPVGMSALREFLTGLGLGDVRSLLQSGNLVFSSPRRSTSDLEKLLEAGTKAQLGLEADFLVRSADEWVKIVAGNPFREEAAGDPGHVLMFCLKEIPAKGAVDALRKAVVGREVIEGVGKNLYVVYPDGIGRSKMTHALIERKLGTRGTGRNWNTVLKIAAMTEPVRSPRRPQ